jgi:hypothetical protein
MTLTEYLKKYDAQYQRLWAAEAREQTAKAEMVATTDAAYATRPLGEWRPGGHPEILAAQARFNEAERASWAAASGLYAAVIDGGDNPEAAYAARMFAWGWVDQAGRPLS